MDLWLTSLRRARDKNNDELENPPNQGQQCDDTYEHNAFSSFYVSIAHYTPLWKFKYDMASQ